MHTSSFILSVLVILYGLVDPVNCMMELGTLTFSDHIHLNHAGVVMFYAPWCKYSKEFLPVLDEADAILSSDGSLQLAKIDCVKNPDLYYKYNVESFPTILGFVGGEPIVYTRERNLQSLLAFSRRISGPTPSSSIGSIKDIFDKSLDQPVLAILGSSHSKVSNLAMEYACKKLDGLNCLESRGDTVGLQLVESELEGTVLPLSSNMIVLARNFVDEEPILYAPEGIAQNLTQFAGWVANNMYPDVVHFTAANEKHMFNQQRPGFNNHVLLIFNHTASYAESLTVMTALRQLAAQYKADCAMAYIDISREEEDKENFPNRTENLLAELQVSSRAEDLPTVLVISSKKTKMEMFALPQGTAVNKASMQQLIDGALKQTITATRTVE